MSGRSVWAFTMASRRRAIVRPIQIGRGLVKRNIIWKAKYFLCDSVIGHTCQNIIGPTGESARDKKLLTIHNLQSLVNRGYSDRSFSEKIALLSETVSKNTKCNTKWTVNLAEHEIEQKSAVGNSWRERT